MKKLLFLTVAVLISYSSFSQQKKPSVYELSNFPEDYICDTITYKNIWWWPVLEDFQDHLTEITYYQVQLDLSWQREEKEFGMGGMSKIMGVTTKKIARQLTTDGMTGYSYNYYGDITGYVIKVKNFGADYFFVITKIVFHEPYGPPIKVYE